MGYNIFARKPKPNDRVFIYALRHPNNSVFYIGQSSRPKERLNEHIREARKGGGPLRYRVIRDILSAGKSPSVKILEETTRKDSTATERRWIDWAIEQGYELANMDYCPLNRRPEYGKKRERR